MCNRLYAAKMCCHEGKLYYSAPVEIATLPDDVNLASMDGWMDGLDLKVAYEYGREWIKQHQPITVDWLILLASMYSSICLCTQRIALTSPSVPVSGTIAVICGSVSI